MRGENQELQQLTAVIDHICGLGEMMCDISQPSKVMNLFYYFTTFSSVRAGRLSVEAARKKKQPNKMLLSNIFIDL